MNEPVITRAEAKKNEIGSLVIGVCLGLLIGGMFGVVGTIGSVRDQCRREAVIHHAAHWSAAKDGDAEFMWDDGTKAEK